MSAIGEMGGIVSNLLGTIGKVILLIIVAFGGFFGTKLITKHRSKKKKLMIRAIISNPDGSHYMDYIGKVKDKDGIDKMMFKFHKTDTCPVIPNKHIVNNSIHLFRYGPSEFAIIPPEMYRNIDVNKFGIKLIPMNMLTFKGLEQRAAITRWQTSKDKLQQWMPWITIIICVGLALGSIYLVAQYTQDNVIKITEVRNQECAELLSVDTLTQSIIKSMQNYNQQPKITQNTNSTSPL